MRFRAYIATSVDGYVATPDGEVKWLEGFHAENYGYERFLEEISTIVMGRATFDQVLGFGEWPYSGKDVFVLTSRPIGSPPERTVAWREGVNELLSHLRGTVRERDVWILGGPRTIEAFRERQAIDSFEIFVLPVLLGDGISLFSRVSSSESLALVRHRSFDDGAIELVYETLTKAPKR